MGFNGFSWDFMGVHVISCVFNRDLMGFNRDSMGFNRDSMGFRGFR